MSRIYIKEFGPVRSGCVENDGWVEFSKVTAFCGPQGSGKSSVVKVYAFFTWLEKVLVRGDHRESAWLRNDKFPKEFKEFHNVADYFRPETILRYRGDAYDFDWQDGRFSLSRRREVADGAYLIPKIMYVPAERNFMSVIEAVDQVKGIPQNLKAMVREFLSASNKFADGIDFPIGGFSYKYDRHNRIGRIVVPDGSEVKLSAASSGLQSMTPLFLVSEYLYRQLTEDRDASKDMSLATYHAVMDEVFSRLSADELPDAIIQGLSQYNAALAKRFINIVEEPEQNLFPATQEQLLFKLLEYARGTDRFADNQLVITTHSPYLVECIKLVSQAADLPCPPGLAGLRTGLTRNSLIGKDEIALYETHGDGTISRHVGDDGFIPDDGSLHRAFDDLSDDYADILEWQDGQFPNG